jgi:hypothetical protein
MVGGLGKTLTLIWYVSGMFIKGQPRQIIGVILGLIFPHYALQSLDLLNLGGPYLIR